MRSITELSSKVSWFSSSKGSIGFTFTSRVGWNKVFNRLKSFYKWWFDRKFDNFSFWIYHEPLHTWDLRKVSLRTSRSRVNHSIEIITSTDDGFQIFFYWFFYISPDLYYESMLFFFWEESFVIVLEHFIIVKVSSLKDIFLFLWHLHVKDIDRSSSNSWVFESVIFDCIGNFYGSLHIIFIKDIREKSLEILISHLSIYIRIVLRQDRIEDYSTNSCLNRLIVLENYDLVF